MKVWLYYRLSRDEDEELNSLNNQRKIIYNFAVSNGHEVVGESFDDNVSGISKARTLRSFGGMQNTAALDGERKKTSNRLSIRSLKTT